MPPEPVWMGAIIAEPSESGNKNARRVSKRSAEMRQRLNLLRMRLLKNSADSFRLFIV